MYIFASNKYYYFYFGIYKIGHIIFQSKESLLINFNKRDIRFYDIIINKSGF